MGKWIIFTIWGLMFTFILSVFFVFNPIHPKFEDIFWNLWIFSFAYWFIYYNARWAEQHFDKYKDK